MYPYTDFSSELSHHGILGQKWGIRRYQNEDGTLTPITTDASFESFIMHYGKPRRSGRYPYGSGEDPYQSITRGRLSGRKKKMLIKKAKKGQEEQKRQAEEEKKRPKLLSEMTEDEIRQSISRLQLEKQYMDLVRSMEPPKPKEDNQKKSSNDTRNKGKNFVADVLRDSGKRAATTVLTATFTYAGATAINKMMGKNIVSTNVKEDDKKK